MRHSHEQLPAPSHDISASDGPVNIAALRGLVDTEEELSQYAVVFLTQAQKDIEALSRLCADGHSSAWVDTAHRLKGAAGMAGARRLHEICARAQSMNPSTRETRAVMLTCIRKAFSDVKASLCVVAQIHAG
jgi:HPt (histidine-containing phosphotransfer) domain-containing protein